MCIILLAIAALFSAGNEASNIFWKLVAIVVGIIYDIAILRLLFK